MKGSNFKILIILPAYNEAGSIGRVVGSVRSLYPDYPVLVIDDGSTDDTACLARKAGARVISHPFNMGYGVALQTGYKYAVRKGYACVCQLDADGQHNPKDIEKLLAPVAGGETDVALGSRFLGPIAYHQSVYRAVGVRLFRCALFILSGRRITDPTTGFQAVNRRVLDVFVRDVFPSDYPDADVIMLLSMLRFRISEVPVTMYPKTGGTSMHRNPVRVFYYVFKMLLSMVLTRMRKYSG